MVDTKKKYIYIKRQQQQTRTATKGKVCVKCGAEGSCEGIPENPSLTQIQFLDAILIIRIVE